MEPRAAARRKDQPRSREEHEAVFYCSDLLRVLRGFVVLFVFLFATTVAAMAGDGKAVVEDKVKDIYVPASFSERSLAGVLQDRMKMNLEGRLLRVDEEAILDGFRHRPGKQAWIGEHAGKFLDAAANAWLYFRDPRIKTLMDRVAHELIKCQLPDGYLGTYSDDKRWTSWDVWVHKYDLIGLLRHYEVTGEQASLDCAKKIGDLLCNTFGDDPPLKDISSAGEHVGMAATSVLEPMCRLYRFTGEKKYLDFCFYITRSIEKNSKVISSLAETKKVFGTANGKAYEMLSNLVGLLELYRINGDEKFLVPAVNAWEDIFAHRLYITGTASSHEHWQDDGVLPAAPADKMGEGCVTVTWMQLNLSLLRLTGEAKYAEQLEKSIYNHLLGAQEANSGDIAYYTPLMGNKPFGHKINCCLSSEPRGISMIPLAVWGRRGDGIAINMFVPGRARIPLNIGGKAIDVEATCETKLPEEGGVVLTVKPSAPAEFPVYIRWPGWAGKPAIADSMSDSGYWRVQVDKSSLTLSLNIQLGIRIHDGGKSYPGCVAVQRGPQVLCVDAARNHTALIPYADAESPRVWLPKAEALGMNP
jgi:DUF1680 family protein